MKFVTYNIQYGKGRDGRIDLARVASAVRDADIVALQEVERFWKRSREVDQPQALADLMPRHRWVYGANFDVDGDVTDGGETTRFRRRQHGTMVLSRWPLLSARNFPLPKLGEADGQSMQCGLLETVVGAPAGALRVYSTHLCPLSPASRLPQIDALRDLLRGLQSQGGVLTGHHDDPTWTEASPPPYPVILAGDFNFEPGSEEYDRITGSLADAWTATGRSPEEGISFVSMDGKDRQRLDYAFLSHELEAVARKAWIDTGTEASDHYPVWVEFDW